MRFCHSCVTPPQNAPPANRKQTLGAKHFPARERIEMRNTWLYALPLALALATPLNASAAGRQLSAPIIADFPFAAAAAAAGTTLVFKDALRPHGRVRGDAVDSPTLALVVRTPTSTRRATFQRSRCMASRGWRFTYAYLTPIDPAAQAQSELDAQAALIGAMPTTASAAWMTTSGTTTK